MEGSIASVPQTLRYKTVISAFLKLPLSIFGQIMGASPVTRIKVLLLKGSLLLQMASSVANHRHQYPTHRKAKCYLLLLLYFELRKKGYDFYTENLSNFVKRKKISFH